MKLGVPPKYSLEESTSVEGSGNHGCIPLFHKHMLSCDGAPGTLRCGRKGRLPLRRGYSQEDAAGVSTWGPVGHGWASAGTAGLCSTVSAAQLERLRQSGLEQPGLAGRLSVRGLSGCLCGPATSPWSRLSHGGFCPMGQAAAAAAHLPSFKERRVNHSHW